MFVHYFNQIMMMGSFLFFSFSFVISVWSTRQTLIVMCCIFIYFVICFVVHYYYIYYFYHLLPPHNNLTSFTSSFSYYYYYSFSFFLKLLFVCLSCLVWVNRSPLNDRERVHKCSICTKYTFVCLRPTRIFVLGDYV